MAEQKSSKTALIIGAVIIALILLWLLLRNNPTAQQIVKQNVPWLQPIMGNAGAPDEYNISVGGYTPGQMPGISQSKCDSNSPCIFCVIPNASYPSKPVKSNAPQYLTDYVVAPKPVSLSQPNTTPIYDLSNLPVSYWG